MFRDVMQTAGLELFAEIGLIIFALTFIVLLIRTVLFKSEEVDYMSALPLADDEGTPQERSHNA